MEITAKVFQAHYGTEYQLLEREFMDTFPYLTLDFDNRRAFSHAYIKIILQAGSLIDVVMHEYCRALDKNFCNGKKKYVKFDDYRNCVIKNAPEFLKQSIAITKCNFQIKPWYKWQNQISLDWWQVYNNLKHHRFENGKIHNYENLNYKFANQRYTVLALGGLYQVLLYADLKIKTNENKLNEIRFYPQSQIFTMIGEPWSNFMDLSCDLMAQIINE